MKYIKLLILFFLIVFLPKELLASDKLVNELKEGGKIVMIRHAHAPGNGDPGNFLLSDCTTQRNLNDEGIQESINIGIFFKKNNVEIDKVLSSEWCRCKDTANYAFKTFESQSFLNSFYNKKFEHNKSKQIKDLKRYIKNWKGEKNLVFVTHYVVILEVLNLSAMSAEIIISDKNFNVLARQRFTNN